MNLICLKCGYVPHTVTATVSGSSRKVVCVECGREGWTLKSAPVSPIKATPGLVPQLETPASRGLSAYGIR